MKANSRRFLTLLSGSGLALLLGASTVVAQQTIVEEDKPADSSAPSQRQTSPFAEPDADSAEAKRRKMEEQNRRYQQMVRDYEARQAATGDGEGTTEKAIPRAEPVKPDDFLGWMSNNNWQRWAEIRPGNVILLRRSTNEPAKPDETVILRWRTPDEYARRAGLSTKRSFPNRPRGPLKERFEQIAAGEGD
ncbi:MAG: hypothetical protein AAGK14_12640 [Verrucomicrobiota bacterium]